MSIQKITEEEIARHGVSSLPNRPSAPSLYGGEAMTADELRAAFDSLPRLVAERLNAFIESAGLYGEEAKESLASLIATHLSEGHSLENLFADVQNGTFANYLSVDEGAQSLTEALSALRSTLSLPDGFSDLRSYVDAPRGRVEEGSPLPVSGNAVFLHTKEVEERISTRILPTDGEVKAGDSLPVSGDRVFQSLTKATSPLDTRLSVIESTMEGLPFHFETVTAEEGKASVPKDALRYARLDSIGGYTRKSKNHIPLKPNTDYGSIETEADGEDIPSTTVTFHTDENGYLCIDTNGKTAGFSSYLNFGITLRFANPENMTLSVRYISGEITPVSYETDIGMLLVLDDNAIPLPTKDNPITTHVGIAPSMICGLSLKHCILSNYKIALQLEEGTTATDFEPYFEGLKSATVTTVSSYGADGALLDTYAVPSAVQALNNYGVGINTATSDVDFFAKTYTSHTYVKRVLNGTENWEKYVAASESLNYFYLRIGEKGSIVTNAIVGTHYPNAVIASTNSNKGIYITNSAAGDARIIIRPNMEYGPSVSDFKEWLANNPITAMYVQANSKTVTDVSDVLPAVPYIETAPGGHVEAISEDGIPARLTVTYQIKNEN